MSTSELLPYLIGVSFAGSGGIAWWCRPASRIGPLMLAYGVLQLAGEGLFRTGVPGLVTAAILVSDGLGLLYFFLLLSFPSGRLSSRREWLVLAPVALALVPGEIAWLMFLPVEDPPGGNVLLLWPSVATADAIDLVQRLLMGAAAVALAAVLTRRWLLASPPLRRTLTPALVGAAAVLIIAMRVLYEGFTDGAPASLELLTVVAFVAVPIALLVTLLRARLARSAVGALFLDLRARREPGELRGAVARVLGDPSLDLAYWLPEFDTYVDVEGRPTRLPEETEHRATTLLTRDGQPVAALLHDPALREEPGRLDEVAAGAGIALENARLQVELRARVEELRGSRMRVIEAADAERRRLERDLHDGAQRRLVSLSLSLGRLEKRLDGDPEVRALVDEAKQEVAGSLQELRDLARGLHPAVVTGHGLSVALQSLAVSAPLPVELEVDLPERLPQPAEVAAYYLVSEALTNTAKHAHATGANVAVRRENGHAVVEVSDDGVGGADTAGGTGLRGLADRVEALEGSLRVWSPRGAGTRLRAEIPCG